MASVPDRTAVATVGIVVAVVLGGWLGAQPATLGDGTATVRVVSPDADGLETEPGRFGTAASYLRLPDLVADVTNVTGTPRLVYRIRVPALDLDRQRSRLIRHEGRLRVSMPDRAFPPRETAEASPPPAGRYDGRLVVRVQSFSTDRTVLNRTVTVRIRE